MIHTKPEATADDLYKGALRQLTAAVACQRLESMKRRGDIMWKTPHGGRLRWVSFTAYSPFAFRIRNDLTLAHFPKKFTGGKDYDFPAPYRFELSFAPEELPAVAAGLVRFVESAWWHAHHKELIWRWPLFAEHPHFPHYAWSRRGAAQQEGYRLANPPPPAYKEFEATTTRTELLNRRLTTAPMHTTQ